MLTLPINGDKNPDQRMALGEALAQTKRWSRYCEGLDGSERAFTAILLENQLQHMGQLNEVTKILQIGNFDKFA